ncbi:SMC-Scp complex subunit ScpB [Jatrophihabitans sp.]|uniref:SMC-Scp complex subunit ScpB n=1 Tax=Jatrophihabitans sp. TaxID=1932789 RepID=UPI002CC0345D|nr:SMC-Scp complex subunit ScpB [Jatrophihabitans sp.]
MTQPQDEAVARTAADAPGPEAEQAVAEQAETETDQAVTEQTETKQAGTEQPAVRPGARHRAPEDDEAEPAFPSAGPAGNDTGPLDLADPAVLHSALEALLFVADGPLQLTQLAVAVQRPAAEVAQALAEITAELDRRQAGWQLRPAATGFRLYTRDRFAPVVEAFLLDGQRTKLSQAALETLAVVAYRQPVTRARISAIRGVNVDGVVRTLLARELITEVGSDPETGGGLYRTTSTFLEKMGISSVDELPSLAPLLPELDTLDLEEL